MVDVVMPQMGESIAEGTIAVWLVDVGGYVEADQPLVQVTTDKADLDIPATVSGTLTEVLAEPGETVKVGVTIARIDETAARQRPVSAESAPELASRKDGPAEHPLAKEGVPASEAMSIKGPAASMEAPREIERELAQGTDEVADRLDRSGFFSPAVMRLAVEHGIELKGLKGTGEGGRVTKADVRKAAAVGSEGAAIVALPVMEEAPAIPVPPAAHREQEYGFGEYRAPHYEVEEGDTELPFSRLRRLIADHMVYSRRTSAHVTTFAEADIYHVVGLRDKNKDRIKSEVGISLTYLPFVMQAAVRALKEYPAMNSVVQGESIIIKKSVNLGIAVDSERGLMVPVIVDAGDMGVVGLAKAVNELSVKVRDKKIGPDELAGGTFTVSNPGRKGNLFGTPIISQPQVGILRMGEVVKRPVVVEVEGEDAVVIRPMMYLSLSYDHRVVDGLTANEFLHRVKEHLEEGNFQL